MKYTSCLQKQKVIGGRKMSTNLTAGCEVLWKFKGGRAHLRLTKDWNHFTEERVLGLSLEGRISFLKVQTERWESCSGLWGNGNYRTGEGFSSSPVSLQRVKLGPRMKNFKFQFNVKLFGKWVSSPLCARSISSVDEMLDQVCVFKLSSVWIHFKGKKFSQVTNII